MVTIHSDVTTENTDLNRDEAAAAFLERWKDPKEVSKGEKGAKELEKEIVLDSELEEAEDKEDQETDKDLDDDTEQVEETKSEKAARLAEDSDEVRFTENGVEHKVSVKDLKRLAGQEASLTRKSQETATMQKAAEDTRAMNATALNTLLQRAEERLKPYAGIDYLVAAKSMSAEDLTAVRSEHQAAYNDYAFLTQELGSVNQQQAEASTKQHQEEAAHALKVLSDPVTGIEGWSQPLYEEMRAYAKSSGMNAQVVDRLTDPTALKLIHKAMAYDKIKSVATAKKATSVKNPIKTSSTTTADKATGSVRAAQKALQASGKREDAANLFLKRWEVAE